MAQLIKKNLWALFIFITLIGFTILLTIIFTLANQTIEKYKQEQENITVITANSFKSLFNQYDMLIDVIATNLKQKSLNAKLFSNKIKKNNPAISHITIVKSNINKNTNLIIKRTIYNKEHKKIVVPLSKTINIENNYSYEITIFLDIQKAFGFFVNNHKSNEKHDTFLFRSEDRYFQFAQKKDFFNKEIYDFQIPIELVNKGIELTQEKYDLSINYIMENEIPVTIKTQDKRNVFHSSIYLNKYKLWVVTQMPFKKIEKELIEKTVFLTVLFMIILGVIYYLFKLIHKEEKKKQEALFYQATHDNLTGIFNRYYLQNIKNLDDKYSLIFLDLDNFKNVNDNFGHLVGDQLLKMITNRVLTLINSKTDKFIRYSGDEFLIITKETSKEKLDIFAQKLLELISKQFHINQYTINTSVSIGIAITKDKKTDLREMIINADMAMYNAKKRKNSCTFFEEDIKSEFLKKALLENELKASINSDEFFMMYQPQMDNQNRLYAVEALVRWNNKNLGFVNPEIFIKSAEDTGVINILGDFIINTSLKEIKEIQNKTDLPIGLSINISAKQFMEKEFLEKLFVAIKNNSFDTNLLTLEITESLFIENVDHVIEILETLKSKGIKISLDDFGTGYSSLSILKKLPIHELKIDKSFVEDILDKKSSEKLVKTIISIAKEFDMKIVAEGIETIEQKSLLTKLKCDLNQGYYFSKPLKKDDLEEYIKNRYTL